MNARSIAVYFRWAGAILVLAAIFVPRCAPASAPQELEFETEIVERVREGHVSLSWNRVDSAASYKVTDGEEHVMYTGPLPQAFISGLEDGKHVFQVQALDSAGQVLARSVTPVTVEVEHWPLSYALGLFVVGLVVVSGVISIILWGSRFSGGQDA